MELQTEGACLNCKRYVSHAYCAHCGQPTKPVRLDFEWFVEELLDVTSHITPAKIIRTAGAMIFEPGTAILDYINGRRIIYQQPLTFLTIGYAIYFLSSEHFFTQSTWESGTLSHAPKLEIFITLLLITIIAHLLLNRPKFNFIETTVVVGYVYGTAFMLAPLVILLQAPLEYPFSFIPMSFRPLAVDIPLIAISLYIASSFIKTAGLSMFRLLIVSAIVTTIGVLGAL